jgi:hypothetical protein
MWGGKGHKQKGGLGQTAGRTFHNVTIPRFAGYFGLTPREAFAINPPSVSCAPVEILPSNHPAMEISILINNFLHRWISSYFAYYSKSTEDKNK